jgi:hypothetical protein
MEAVRTANVQTAGGDPAALTSAVAASLTAAAPSDPIEALWQAIERRFARMEHVIGLVAPFIDEAATVAGLIVPQAAPLLDRMTTLEAAFAGFLASAEAGSGDMAARLAALETSVSDTRTAIHTAFGGKMALPPAPSPVHSSALAAD